MIIERNEDEANFFMEIIKEYPKESKKTILNTTIKKLKEDIEESKVFSFKINHKRNRKSI